MIFRALARRRPPQARPIELGPYARVLCFTCAGIGDTLTDSVVFKALRETFPEAHLAAVVHRRRRLLLEHNPCVDQIFHFQKGRAHSGACRRNYARRGRGTRSCNCAETIPSRVA